MVEKMEMIKGMSVGENVYHFIKSNIISWKLKPGTRLSEKEMSQNLKVSRTPVREAFIKLSKEGLLTILPQRGTFVSKIDLAVVKEERLIREAIELKVMQEIASREFSKTHLELLKENIKAQKEMVDSLHVESFSELDDEFHRLIYEGLSMFRSYEVIRMVSSQYKRIRVLNLFEQKVLNELVLEHQKLFNAIISKDSESAVMILKKHVRKLLVEERVLKDRYREYFM